MSFVRSFLIAGILIAAVLAAGCTAPQSTTPYSPTGVSTSPVVTKTPSLGTAATTPVVTSVPLESWEKVRLETSKGTIVVALDPDMPITAGNFETLVRNKYYDGVIFHRVIDGFMIQSGDPTGTGRGGPGYAIKDEFMPGNRNDRGTLSMANSGPNTGGSQFFINLVDNNYLDSRHPVFGKVVEGMDVVDQIGKVPTNGEAGGHRPLQNVTIIRAEMV
jgi:peptidylprolyl isomerase